MTWKTTPEQNAIIVWRGSQLVVNAFVGTGKRGLKPNCTLSAFSEQIV